MDCRTLLHMHTGTCLCGALLTCMQPMHVVIRGNFFLRTKNYSGCAILFLAVIASKLYSRLLQKANNKLHDLTFFFVHVHVTLQVFLIQQ